MKTTIPTCPMTRRERALNDIEQGQQAIAELRQELKDVLTGKIPTGHFSQYKTKAHAKRAIYKAIADWQRDIIEWEKEAKQLSA